MASRRCAPWCISGVGTSTCVRVAGAGVVMRASWLVIRPVIWSWTGPVCTSTCIDVAGFVSVRSREARFLSEGAGCGVWAILLLLIASSWSVCTELVATGEGSTGVCGTGSGVDNDVEGAGTSR